MSRLPNYPPTPIKLATYADYTGGLNTRADAFQLAPNESPDMLDVDVQIGGGFVQRRVVAPWGAALAGAPQTLFSYTTLSVQQVIAQVGTTLYKSTGSTWSSIGTVGTAKVRFAVFNGYLYGVQGNGAAFRFDGTTFTSLGTAWNETIGGEGGTDGNMPYADTICSHLGRVWIAGTYESGTHYPNRIRWSHANAPEDWRQEDFIDIDVGRDGDYITAIVEFRERLYIFKNDSISELTGYGPQNFQVVPITQDIGCVSQEAVTNTDVGLFFFSWPQGVYLDKGQGPYPIFDKIWPSIRDGLIPAAYKTQIALGYVNRMLWAAVPWNGSTVNTRVLVYNPWIFKHRWLRFLEGPWYPYNLPISCFTRFNQTSGAGTTLFLAGNSQAGYVGQLDQAGNTDNWGAGSVNLNSYYTTNWIDLGQEAVVKRWRHPDIMLRAGANANVRVDVKRNYDPSKLYKTYFVGQSPTSSSLVWDDGTGTVGGKWDDGTGTVGGKWSDLPTTGENIVRGSSMGSAKAIQLTFTGPSGLYWGCDAITYKYILKRVRG